MYSSFLSMQSLFLFVPSATCTRFIIFQQENLNWFLWNDEFHLKFINVLSLLKIYVFSCNWTWISILFSLLNRLAIHVLFQTNIDSLKCNMFICSCDHALWYINLTNNQSLSFFISLIYILSNQERESHYLNESVFVPNIHKMFYLLCIFK